MTRILVTGASGLLGLNLCLSKWQDYSITGIDRGKLKGTPFAVIPLEFSQPGAITRLIETVRPDAIIHTAANANIDSCETDPAGAQYINAELPGEIATCCNKRNIKLIHISTDAVFDGTKESPYTEEDDTNPLGVYARTKLAGEQHVLSANPTAIVARVNFFGWSLSGTRSLPEFFHNRLSAGHHCNGFTDVYFCPMFVNHLADILFLMLEKDLSGLYHVVGSEPVSKYDFGQRIACRFGFDPNLITPKSVEESGLKARRSHNLRLSIQKLSTHLGVEIPGVSSGIDGFYTQALHSYPQKMRSYQQL